MTTEPAPARAPGAAPRALLTAGVGVPGGTSLVPGASGRAHDTAASAALVASARDVVRAGVRVRVVVGGAPGSTVRVERSC